MLARLECDPGHALRQLPRPEVVQGHLWKPWGYALPEYRPPNMPRPDVNLEKQRFTGYSGSYLPNFVTPDL